eukprot:916957-Karenia_brevis.AAC.1
MRILKTFEHEEGQGGPGRAHGGPASPKVGEGSFKSRFGRSRKGEGAEGVKKIELLMVHFRETKTQIETGVVKIVLRG